MKKYSIFSWLLVILSLAFVSCSDSDDDGSDGDVTNQTEEAIAQKLVGEWICYYQYWEEGGEDPYQEDEYYNTDDLSLTFNKDFSAYLKREGDPLSLLEIGSSQHFRYSLSGKTIHAIIYGEDTPWEIKSLTDKELQLKWQDDDYIIIAKFVKRVSPVGKVSEIRYKTEFSSNSNISYETISFLYDFRGELNGITSGNGTLTYGSWQDDFMNIKWYNGDKLKLVEDKDVRKKEVFSKNTSIAKAWYDKDGYLSNIASGANDIKFGYSDGNMVSSNYLSLTLKYEYSKEKNDANIDLNYFTDPWFVSFGKKYGYENYLELGLAGKKSKNLVSKIFSSYTDVDYYFTYSYERDSEDRISKIIRNYMNSYDDGLLGKTTIEIDYYTE